MLTSKRSRSYIEKITGCLNVPNRFENLNGSKCERFFSAFGRAIQALSRIGDEFWLDPTLKGLALRAVNPSHSAYSCFLFSPLFFQRYKVGSGPSSVPFKCKLSMKSVLPLFRCLTSIERSVDQCQISVSSSLTDRVTVQLFCRHGITKTYNLHFQESEALQAVFATHLCPNMLKCPARLFADMVMHFPMSQEEVTLSTSSLRVSLRNYCEEGKNHMKMMHTQMSLHPDEFDHFELGEDSDITFCLKELRGLLAFAESHCLPVSVHFGTAGKPVCFSVEDLVVEARVVLATLTDSESRSASQPSGVVTTSEPRCADAAFSPVAQAGSRRSPVAPDPLEKILSSQGSPIINPPKLVPAPPGDPYGNSPAATVCSLLFRALSSDTDHQTETVPVLACCSDEEESMEEDYRSPRL
ncbi:cell cycle checkpoint control protein RAD9B isoform X1 [Takifugu rubripes]|uniref:cell cycle checkpoint control protein RAD9B isoform X1 n=1 Tax=Takifugu rubripes TaxID=31033 RepID=UPI001145D7E8|nr:cell cycle checkpoint control protein RAD9B isoform X1 [Takifugu rubripes]XP_029684963.1 cell cycle checkpoint control protein RAD9B isoform X1 [Takifugu rubripes]